MLHLDPDNRLKVYISFAYHKHVQAFPQNAGLSITGDVRLKSTFFPDQFFMVFTASAGAMDQEAPAPCPKPNPQVTLPIRFHSP